MTKDDWHDVNDPDPRLASQMEAMRRRAAEEKKREFADYQAGEAHAARIAREKLIPTITDPCWEHTDPTRAQESPDGIVVGDKILLEFKTTDIIQGANIIFYIEDKASEAPWLGRRKIDSNIGKDGIVRAEWIVDKNKNDSENPQFHYWAEDPDCKKPVKSDVAPPIPCRHKTTCDFIEIPDVLFSRGSAMSQLDENGHLIGALCAVFVYAKDHSGSLALVCGHADKADEGMFTAFDLSKLRAEGITALLSGDEEPWLDVANDFSGPKDFQRFLATLASSYGWDCSPGKIDGLIGPKAKSAVKKYKTEFNKRFTGSLRIRILSTARCSAQCLRSSVRLFSMTIKRQPKNPPSPQFHGQITGKGFMPAVPLLNRKIGNLKPDNVWKFYFFPRTQNL